MLPIYRTTAASAMWKLVYLGGRTLSRRSGTSEDRRRPNSPLMEQRPASLPRHERLSTIDSMDSTTESSRHYRHGVLLFGVALVGFAVLAHHYWFVCDDAFISFRYARNLASGIGLRYNPGDHLPVEGYSNLLWVLLCSLFERLGMDPSVWAPLASAACGAALLWSVWRWLRSRVRVGSMTAFLALLSLALFPPFAVWSSGGLETMAFTLAVFWVFSLLTRQKALSNAHRVALSLGLVAMLLLRVDGFVWAALLVVSCVAASGRRAAGLLRGYLWSLVAVGVFVLFYLLWRHAYHGSFISNTAAVKGVLTSATVVRGMRYVGVFLLTFPACLVVVAAAATAVRRWGMVGRAAALVLAGTVAYAALAGGDFMAMGRLLVPGLPFSAVVLACLFQCLGDRASETRRWAGVVLAAGIILLGLLPVWNIHVVPLSVRERLHFRYNASVFRSEPEQWSYMKENSDRWKAASVVLGRLARPGDSIVSLVIGNLGYYSGMRIYDACGLVDRRVASRPANPGRFSPGHDKLVTADYFIDREPTYIWQTVVEAQQLRDKIGAYVPVWQEISRSAPYAPAILAVRGQDGEGERLVLVLLRRLAPGESAEEAWRGFSRNVMEAELWGTQ